MELTGLHLLGIIITFFIVFSIGVYSSRQVKNPQDFSVSSYRSGPFMVMGTIIGTMVGGSATIGTAQMAYLFGFSAWWFTLGSGIGCLVIAVFLIKPMRSTFLETIPQYITGNYGRTAGITATVFITVGTFLNLIPQFFSSTALLSSMFTLDFRFSAVITALLITLYVFFGGVWGTGLMGIMKTVLTLSAMIVLGATALVISGGIPAFTSHFPSYPWFSLFGRGINTDLASAFSLLVGILSSQIYFQAIFSARSLTAARGGALMSSFLAPLIGLGGITVGLHMRMHFPDINPAQALPMFILQYIPPLFAGILLFTLLLVTIATGAGLSLGVSTVLTRDVFLRIYPRAGGKVTLFMYRVFIVLITLVALVIGLLNQGEVLILNWGYLALGLRGASVCFPLLAAIFLKGKIAPKAGAAAVILSPILVIAGYIFALPINPLFPGLAVSMISLVIGYLSARKQRLQDLQQ